MATILDCPETRGDWYGVIISKVYAFPRRWPGLYDDHNHDIDIGPRVSCALGAKEPPYLIEVRFHFESWVFDN